MLAPASALTRVPSNRAVRFLPIYRIGRNFSFAALLSFGLAACEKEEKKAAPPPPVVKVAEAVMRDVPIGVEAIGQTRGNTEIEISARVEGFLETMDFKEGSFVKKGQRLYTIDNRPFKASVAQAQASLAEADAAAGAGLGGGPRRIAGQQPPGSP